MTIRARGSAPDPRPPTGGRLVRRVERGWRRGPAAVVAALLVVLLGGSACSTTPTGGDEAVAAPGDPSDAGASLADVAELTVTTSFAIADLDPLENGFWAAELGYGDLLVRPQPGGTLEPWVLESLEPASDTEWTLTLRDDVTFQNGTPLDGPTLATLMNWHLAENDAVAPLLPEARATATDDRTVVLDTGVPTPDVPSLLGSENAFVLFDLAAYEPLRDRPEALVDARIYTGPYTVTSVSPERLELEPTEGYYGGTPPLRSLTVTFVPDADARVKAVQNGEADVALYPPTAAARRLEHRDDAVYRVEEPGTGTAGLRLFVNQRRPPLDDVRVRRAVQHAIDYAELADDVFDGLYDRATGLYPAQLDGAVENLRTDPEEAAQLLDEAGWCRDDADGVRARDGRPLAITLLTYPQQPDAGAAAVAIESQLAPLGFEVSIRSVDDIHETMEDPAAWDLAVSFTGALGITGTDPIRPLQRDSRTGGDRNQHGPADPGLDARIDELAVTLDEERRVELLAEIQEIVVGEAHGWFVAVKRNPVVVAPHLVDYEVPAANLWLTPFTPSPGG